MKMRIEYSVDDKKLKKIYASLKIIEKQSPQAMANALNRATDTAKSKLSSNITKVYNIKKSALSGGGGFKSDESNNLIKVHKASKQDLSAYVDVRGRYLTLYRFVPSAYRLPNNKKGSKIAVKVKKGKQKKLSKNHFINYPKGQRGNYQIFQKESATGQIRRLARTTSVAAMAKNEKVIEPTLAAAQEMLNKRIEHELKRIWS